MEILSFFNLKLRICILIFSFLGRRRDAAEETQAKTLLHQ